MIISDTFNFFINHKNRSFYAKDLKLERVLKIIYLKLLRHEIFIAKKSY